MADKEKGAADTTPEKKEPNEFDPIRQSFRRQHGFLSLLELFEHELAWCKGECGENSHGRAYATPKTRTVHMALKVATRSSLLTGLHEIGHIVANTAGMRRW
jgi:hypothetical protein